MLSLTDEYLVKSCAKGNKHHSRLLYERYKGFVWKLVFNYFKDVETIKDMTQEIFLNVFKGIGKFRHDSSFKTWLARTTVNTCISHSRAMKTRKTQEHFSIDDPDDNTNKADIKKDTHDNPMRHLLQKEKNKRIKLGIDTLKPEEQTTILLWSEGFAYDEIAKITNTNQITVGTRIYHIKIKLKKTDKLYGVIGHYGKKMYRYFRCVKRVFR